MIFEETIKFLNKILYFLLYILLTKINKFSKYYIYIYIYHLYHEYNTLEKYICITFYKKVFLIFGMF